MEPQIRYARTSDGASIAYYTRGEGAPVIYVSSSWSHVRLAAKLRRIQTLDEHHAAAGRMAVRYDGRGMGSSDRGREEFSLDARLCDLQAIMDHLHLGDVTLVGFSHGGPTCVAYAAMYPERVGHLVLLESYARGEDYYRHSPSVQGLPEGDDVPQARWDFYYRMLARALVGTAVPGDGEEENKMTTVLRESMAPSAAIGYRDVSRGIDVTHLLSRISVPTLVIRRAGSPFGTVELSQELAAGIKDARFVMSDDVSPGAASLLIDEFLGGGLPLPAQEESGIAPQQAGGTAVILFADIASSTALTERLGDTAFRERSRAIDAAVREAVRAAGGMPVEGKVMGDGVMSIFTSARQAIDAALRCREASARHELPLHLGIHAGDVIRERDNVYGGAVNIAARICDASAPGEILVSEIVRGLARTSAGVAFEGRGEHALKGIDEPQRLWAVVAPPG